jgi:hypothetical protein
MALELLQNNNNNKKTNKLIPTLRTAEQWKQHTRVRSIFARKTNILQSGLGGLHMRTSLAYRAVHVTGIYLNLADSLSRPTKDSRFCWRALVNVYIVQRL